MTGASESIPRYDTIGVGYRRYRMPDARIAAQIHEALGGARSVVNIGAGTGSYEPTDREVIAVEPSAVMIAQRPAGSARVVQACAESLPFADASVDACMGVLTAHHWTDLERGLAEAKRVARRRVVLLTWVPDHEEFWLRRDYFPELDDFDLPMMPSIERMEATLGRVTVTAVPVPHDCTDGFLGAYWRRPHAYLDANARAAISAFAMMPDVASRIDRLRSDLESGAWMARNNAICERETLDLGYRLVVFERGEFSRDIG